MKKKLSWTEYSSSIFKPASKLFLEFIIAYRVPFFYLATQSCTAKIYPQTNQYNQDLEAQLTPTCHNKDILNDFPATNPKFFKGSFFTNLSGLIIQISVLIFLNNNAEKDSDASGILTTLPKNTSDIVIFGPILLAKDILLNMVELGLSQKAFSSKNYSDYFSTLCFAAMRTTNYIRFPNYLHHNKLLQNSATLGLYCTSFLSGLFFLASVSKPLMTQYNFDQLGESNKRHMLLSNCLLGLGSLSICLSSTANITSFANRNSSLPLLAVTIIGTTRMALFIVANYLGKKVSDAINKC